MLFYRELLKRGRSLAVANVDIRDQVSTAKRGMLGSASFKRVSTGESSIAQTFGTLIC